MTALKGTQKLPKDYLLEYIQNTHRGTWWVLTKYLQSIYMNVKWMYIITWHSHGTHCVLTGFVVEFTKWRWIKKNFNKFFSSIWFSVVGHKFKRILWSEENASLPIHPIHQQVVIGWQLHSTPHPNVSNIQPSIRLQNNHSSSAA